MKYKHVFLLWLWADLILGLGTILTVLFMNITSGFAGGDYAMILWVVLFGVAVSIPSLIALLIIHSIYIKNSLLKLNYFNLYSIAILCINIIYSLSSYFIFDMKGELNLLFFFSTLAGFISLFLIRMKIKKEQQKEYIA
jgi:heme exporter protein D